MARTPEELPIQRARDEIRNAVRNANRLVVVAPTGSGKSTQLPKMLLDLEGVISADRRYVTMNVNFSVSDDLKFRDIPVQGAAGGGDIGGGRASTFTGVIQLPEINVTSVATTASVPDKGTMLLGGQRRFKEFEVESGIPVLSKIPIVNRFFTNRIDSEEELSTVILIRPEIVIQQENEDELFPGLSEQIGSMGG